MANKIRSKTTASEPTPFDITAADIVGVDDVALREVLKTLAASELQTNGLPASALTAGGDQNARDGGVDLRVEWSGLAERTEWLPHRCTLLQSKAERMPPKKVVEEMCPHDQPRAIFTELVAKEGAYLICASENCSDDMLNARRSAMRAALTDIPGNAAIQLDFYDADRLARWCNCHIGAAARVRELVQRPMHGWRPFENWSFPNISTDAPYLSDDVARITVLNGEKISATDGINTIRAALSRVREIVRLVGVSGTGKTRLAQALFDPRVGLNPLPSSKVVYGDLAQELGTSPSQIAEQLVLSGRRAILVVDNCPGATHRALATVTGRAGSNVSLLTIDFDVGLDQPDNTLVVRLHENSDDLIETLLKERMRNLSVFDRSKIRDLSWGNARVALKIAETAAGGESLANLSDQEIIQKLFLDGRRPTDDTHYRCAEAASLVYAFLVEQDGQQPPEHPILAELADVDPMPFYRAVDNFVDRGTAQKRGPQRAILPQPLAIHLARQALRKIPHDHLIKVLYQPGRERLLGSFTRRLGQLHDSAEAQKIARDFVQQQLSDASSLTDFGMTLLENLAPTATEEALAALERATNGSSAEDFLSTTNPNRRRLARLARKLAYEEENFPRAARVLLELAKRESENERNDPIREQFQEMFWIGLSFTKAPPSVRFKFLDDLIASHDEGDRQVGLEALDYALTTGTRSSSFDYEFGVRPRGDEWRPQTIGEQNQWFRDVLQRLMKLAIENGELKERALRAIAGELRGLLRIGLTEEVIEACDAIRAEDFWSEGWKHIRMAMYFDQKKWPSGTAQKVNDLEKRLGPSTIEERFHAYVVEKPWDLYEPARADSDEPEINTFELAQQVGTEAAGNAELRLRLAIRALSYSHENNCYAFGRGLGAAVQDVQSAWREFLKCFGELPDQKRNPATLVGFLEEARKRFPEYVQMCLNDAVEEEALGPHIVALSQSTPLDEISVNRLLRAISVGKAPVASYLRFAGGRVTEHTPPVALEKLLRALVDAGSDGAKTAANILHMHLFCLKQEKRVIPDEIASFARDLLCNRTLYSESSQNDGYHYAEIAGQVLTGDANKDAARQVCTAILDGSKSAAFHLSSLDTLCRKLTKLHPKVVLELVMADDRTARREAEHFFGDTDDDFDHSRRSRINVAPEILMAWVQENPRERATRLASIIPYMTSDDGQIAWEPFALQLATLAGIGTVVLDVYYERFCIGGFWGPWHTRLSHRRPLLVALTRDDNPDVRVWAERRLRDLDEMIRANTETERRRDERFE